MSKTKGAKNKTKIQETENRYYGCFLIDTGFIFNFDISECDAGETFAKLLDVEWPFKEDNIIYLGEHADIPFLRAKRIIGWYINIYTSDV